MNRRDRLREFALLGIAGLLLVVAATDAHGDRVVNANEPVVIFDDIRKTVTTVESRSFPPKTVAPAIDPGPDWGDNDSPVPAAPRPTFDDSSPEVPEGWPGPPPTTGPGGPGPSSPPQAWPRNPRRPLGGWRPSAGPPPPGGNTPADPGRRTSGTDDDPGNDSTTGPGSRPSEVLRFTRPASTTGEVTVTTEDGSVGSAEIESSDPNSDRPETP